MLSLMPNLINNLDDSGCPLIDYAETNGPLSKPQSLNTTNRVSMLRFLDCHYRYSTLRIHFGIRIYRYNNWMNWQ